MIANAFIRIGLYAILILYGVSPHSVLRALPRYCDHHKIPKPRSLARDYLTYQATIDEIIKVAGGSISRNGFRQRQTP